MNVKERINKTEALTFLLSHIVVDREHSLNLDQLTLFQLTAIAQQAAEAINRSDETIPHEVIESLAEEFLRSQ